MTACLVASDALGLVGDRFLRQPGGQYLDLATGISVELTADDPAESTTRSVAVARDNVTVHDTTPCGAAVAVVAGRLPNGERLLLRRARMEDESPIDWSQPSADRAGLGRLVAVLDAAEPQRARVVCLDAPAGTALSVAERVAFEASARGFVPLSPALVASVPGVVNELRDRSVVALLTDCAPGEDAGRRALGSVLCAISPVRVLVVVRVAVVDDGAATETGPRSREFECSHGEARSRVAGRATALLARRRFASCDRALRRAAYLSSHGDVGGSRLEAALTLAERQRRQGRTRAAIGTIARARNALTAASPVRALFDVAALYGCLRTDLGQLETARTLLESAWAMSRAAGGRGHAGCGVMLAWCCAWQGHAAGAAETLAQVGHDRDVDETVAARWWALKITLLLARGDAGAAHRTSCEARRARQWTDPIALASLAVAGVRLCGVLGDLEGVVRTAREGVDAALRANSIVARAEVRAEELGARIRMDRPRAEWRTVCTWLEKYRMRVPLLLRWQVDGVLHTAGAGRRRRARSMGISCRECAARPNWSLEGRRLDVVEEVVDVLRICHDTDDDRELLERVCALLKTHLGAVAVGVDAEDGTVLARASAAGRVAFSLAGRAVRLGSSIPPIEVDASMETAVAVRYMGVAVAALCARWCRDDKPDVERAMALLTTAAAAAAPAVRSALDRRALPGAVADDLGIVGISRVVGDLKQQVRQAARVPFPVLIEGESGSGKELVARALHQVGVRRQRRFCAINCAALTDELFEAELFGHARGAFTGAVGERAGVFEEADGGTLFLDEVTELSPRAQAKLLRVLQEGEVRRIGENLPRRVDARVVAATNRSLSHEVRHGRFRDDLRYRLDVVRIVVPALRERREDIGLLAAHFWRDAAVRAGSRATLDPEALAALARHDWPGNVRELQNVMALLAVSAPRRGRVLPGMLPVSIRQVEPSEPLCPRRLDAARRSFEQAFVRDALARNGGRRATTALELGVTRQGLAKLLARLGLDEPLSKVS